MYINFAILSITPGREAEFEEQMKGSTDSPMYSEPGWLSNSCLRDNDHPGRYFYNSIWETFDQLKAYRQTQAYGGVSKGMTNSGLYVGRPDQFSASMVARHGRAFVWP